MRKRHIQAQSLKVAFLGAEAWGTELRERLQSQYNIELFDIYGLTEILGPGVACECGIHDGLHVFEEHFYPEVVGIESEECCAEGEVGELVLTTLTKRRRHLYAIRRGIKQVLPISDANVDESRQESLRSRGGLMIC